MSLNKPTSFEINRYYIIVFEATTNKFFFNYSGLVSVVHLKEKLTVKYYIYETELEATVFTSYCLAFTGAGLS